MGLRVEMVGEWNDEKKKNLNDLGGGSQKSFNEKVTTAALHSIAVLNRVLFLFPMEIDIAHLVSFRYVFLKIYNNEACFKGYFTLSVKSMLVTYELLTVLK